MGIGSIAFPLIGAGRLGYPEMDVIKALVDACSLFREKDSKLKTVSIVVWKYDLGCQEVSCQVIILHYRRKVWLEFNFAYSKLASLNSTLRNHAITIIRPIYVQILKI